MEIIKVGTEIRITGDYHGKKYSARNPYVINLQPVEEFNLLLEGMIGSEEACRKRRLAGGINDLVERAGRMNKDQLGYLVSGLLGQIQKYTQLLQEAYDHPDKFAEFVRGYRAIVEGAGPYVNVLRGLSDLAALEECLKLAKE